MPQLIFYPVLDNTFLMGMLVIALLLPIVRLRPHGRLLTKRGIRCLVALRLLTFLLLATALLRPTLLYTETRRLAASLHLALDRSESMSIADEAGGKSRYDTAIQALRDAEPVFRKAEKQLEIIPFVFDRTFKPLAMKEGKIEGLDAKPTGSETAIGSTLEQILLRSGGKRILGTILLSDGTQRSRPPYDALPEEAVARYHDAGSPIFPVLLGRSGSGDAQDVAVADLEANDRVFVRNEFLVQATVRITGYTNKPIDVSLMVENEQGEMRRVDGLKVTVREEGRPVAVKLSYTPTQVGLFKYSVVAELQPKELIATNNTVSGFVRVADGGINVFYMAGQRRYGQGALRQALDASSDIGVHHYRLQIDEVLALARKAKQKIDPAVAEYTAKRPSLLEEAFKPEKFNVYILDDIDAQSFKPEELKALAELVKGGSGLLLLGGYHSYGPGGYGETALADPIPIVMSSLEKQSYDRPMREENHHSEPTRMLPSDYGKGHSVMKLLPGRAENDALWKEMPKLEGANRFGMIKPGATVLAEDENGAPLLVAQTFGAGRVLAFAGDSTWRWVMHGYGERQRRFWRQVILWLAKMDESTGGSCWVTLEKSRLYQGETTSFQVFLKSKLGGETIPAVATAELVRPDGRIEPLPTVDMDGIPSGTIRATEKPGDYAVRVRATAKNAEPGTDPASWNEASTRFIVYEQNLELENPVASPKLLESMAATTEGRTIAPEQLEDLLNELIKRSDELVEQRETKKSLYDTWWLLTLFVALSSCEWFCRKKWGLV